MGVGAVKLELVCIKTRTDSFEKTLMLRRIEGGTEGDDRGRNGWMASPTQQT